ncbi:MAG: flagellar basal body L-ring protein FlgH [Alphaproteobacteria bacterium]|nr:flagellar basal body L-ring protein FlgH [Alphaproteobacteria bacterium]
MNISEGKKRMRPSKTIMIVATALSLGACSTVDRLNAVGQAPALTPIIDPRDRNGDRVVTMPMPHPEAVSRQPNSLWAAGARSFFKDQRATKIGDIVTVMIDISDKAEVSNKTSRSRKSGETADITNLLGLEGAAAGQLLPDGFDPSAALGVSSDSSTDGQGSVNRKEKVELTVAAVVTQVLPNGNLVLEGHQEVRINFELRDLSVSGIVRPEDISAVNEVKHTQMAEARISYGGRGMITDVQQPRYGQQVVDILFPF